MQSGSLRLEALEMDHKIRICLLPLTLQILILVFQRERICGLFVDEYFYCLL